REPAARHLVGGKASLSADFRRRPARQGPRVPRALLPPGADRGATRRAPRRARRASQVNSRGFVYLAAGTGLLVLILAAFAVGRYPVSVAEILHLLQAKIFGTTDTLPANIETVIWQVRGPRVLAALLVGASLAAAGSAYQ